MKFATKATPQALASITDAKRSVFWLDRPERPEAEPSLEADISTDLVVIGGGFTGLWAALLAHDVDPDRDIVLIERTRIGDGGTGRNGGFVAASLTHGFGNGLSRWPGELPTLLSMGLPKKLRKLACKISRCCKTMHANSLLSGKPSKGRKLRCKQLVLSRLP